MQQSGRATCATRRRSCRRSIPDEGPRETFGSLRDREKHWACSWAASQKGKFSRAASWMTQKARPAHCFAQASRTGESALPEFHDCGIIEVFFGGAFNIVVRFPSRGRGGQRDAELIGEVEREPEILVHEAQGKTWNVLAF